MSIAGLGNYLQIKFYDLHTFTGTIALAAGLSSGLSWAAARFVPRLHSVDPMAAATCTAVAMLVSRLQAPSIQDAETQKSRLADWTTRAISLFSGACAMGRNASLQTRAMATALSLLGGMGATLALEPRNLARNPVTTGITALQLVYTKSHRIALAGGISHLANQYLLPRIPGGTAYQSEHAAALSLLATSIYYIMRSFYLEIEHHDLSNQDYLRSFLNRIVTYSALIKLGASYLGIETAWKKSALALGTSLLFTTLNYGETQQLNIQDRKVTSGEMLQDVCAHTPSIALSTLASYGAAYGLNRLAPSLPICGPKSAAALTLLATSTFFLTQPLFKQAEIAPLSKGPSTVKEELKPVGLLWRCIWRGLALSSLIGPSVNYLKLDIPSWKHAVVPLSSSLLAIARRLYWDRRERLENAAIANRGNLNLRYGWNHAFNRR